MSADSYHQDCGCCNGNDGCFSIFVIAIMAWVLCVGEPDLLDGIIHWLMK